jgi:hypothetical protein
MPISLSYSENGFKTGKIGKALKKKVELNYNSLSKK